MNRSFMLVEIGYLSPGTNEFVAIRGRDALDRYLQNSMTDSTISVRIGSKIESWSLKDFASYCAFGDVPKSQAGEIEMLRSLALVRKEVLKVTDSNDIPESVSGPPALRRPQEFTIAVTSGTAAVGKTGLVHQFVFGALPGEYNPTCEDWYKKSVEIGNKVYLVNILDTGGQEDYKDINRENLMNKDGYLVVVSAEDVELTSVSDFAHEYPFVFDHGSDASQEDRGVSRGSGRYTPIPFLRNSNDGYGDSTTSVPDIHPKSVLVVSKWDKVGGDKELEKKLKMKARLIQRQFEMDAVLFTHQTDMAGVERVFQILIQACILERDRVEKHKQRHNRIHSVDSKGLDSVTDINIVAPHE